MKTFMCPITDLRDFPCPCSDNGHRRPEVSYLDNDSCDESYWKNSGSDIVVLTRPVKFHGIDELCHRNVADIMFSIELVPKNPEEPLVVKDFDKDIPLKRHRNTYYLPFTQKSPLICCMLQYTAPFFLSQTCDVSATVAFMSDQLRELTKAGMYTVRARDDLWYRFFGGRMSRLGLDEMNVSEYSRHVSEYNNTICVGTRHYTEEVRIGNEETPVYVGGILFKNLLERLEKLEKIVKRIPP